VVPFGSVTPLEVSDAIGADEVVAATSETTGVAVSMILAGVVASEVADEVARTASELVLLLALHADFLDEVMVELEK